MSAEMNTCAGVKEYFALYLYGELSFDEEERVESHLDGCVKLPHGAGAATRSADGSRQYRD